MTISRRDLLRSLTFGAAAVGTVGFAPMPTHDALSAFAGAARPGELLQLAVAWPSTDAHRAVLARLDDTHAIVDGGVELLLWPGDAATLTEAGIPFRVTVEDLVARDMAEAAAAPATAAQAGVEVPGGIDDYADLDEIYAEFAQLVADHGDIVTLVDQPNVSLEGRTVKRLEIAIGDGRDGRPIAYVDGIHHAREWPAAEYCRQFAHMLCEQRDTERIRTLLEKVMVVIVPVVNVDGFVLSRSHAGSVTDNSLLGIVAGGQFGYQRKNNRSAPVDEAHAVDAAAPGPGGEYDAHYGVDPNRNYAYLWGGTTGGLVNYTGPGGETLPLYASTSPNPFDQTYFGAAPFSEPCTQNTRAFFLTHNVITYFSNHTQGQLMLRPWGHTDEPSVDDALLTEFGASFSEAMAVDGYPPYDNKIGLGLYATNGTANDWAYAATGTLGYVVEHSTSFHPGYFTPHGPGTRSAAAMEQFTRLAEAALDPRATGVLRATFVDADGAPLAGAEVTLTRTFTTPVQEAGPRGIGAITAGLIDGIEETLTLSLRTDENGAIEWYLNPSTRPIVAAENGEEAYVIAVDGTPVAGGTVVLGRGAVVDLETITVA